MIQDIKPAVFVNHYESRMHTENDRICLFMDGKICIKADSVSGDAVYPLRREFSGNADTIYIFTIDDENYYLQLYPDEVPDGYGLYSLHEMRTMGLASNKGIFAAYSAFHLWKWYSTSRFCGSCGEKTVPDTDERAMVCPACGNRIYPRINPAVIVGVKNGERILLTKYKSGFAHNALVAGFVEFGETLEDTVRREVMEEAGIRVKNIKYFGSQPWGIALDLLAGFYCEVAGDDTIHMDRSELKYAEWVNREDIILQPSGHSLTNEMMKRFKEGIEK